ncbi:MAG: SDR family NAD(P)-dependent oxidoreductase [Actinomycetota bacterium]|nr:SDR family NAD(P)-dependent oxidoreductase [Actinomycetota bacterium]
MTGLDPNGKTALVTGATGGIGNAIARALHGRGATVKVTGRRAEVLEELARELGDRVEVLPADLASADDVRRLAGEAGEVDVLVANAGLPGTGKLTEYSPEQIDRVLDVNLRSAVHLTHALLPGLIKRASGHLIYISSISGKVASPQASLYNATKFGLRGFSLALHDDLRESGVGVTTIFPGFISDAGMWADSKLDAPSGSGVRKPEDVADAVLKALAKNPREIDVAGVIPRVGGKLAGAAPALVAGMQRRSGGEKVSAALADAQREKR